MGSLTNSAEACIASTILTIGVDAGDALGVVEGIYSPRAVAGCALTAIPWAESAVGHQTATWAKPISYVYYALPAAITLVLIDALAATERHAVITPEIS